MSQEFFRANVSSEVSNPLGIYGGTRCAVGVVFVCVAGWFLTDLSSTIKEVIATEGAVLEHQPVLTSGRLALVVFAALWLVVGVRMVVGGARSLGRLILPARAPAEYRDYENDLAAALEKGEMPAYAIPKRGPWRLAYRFFPRDFPLMTRAVRKLVSNNLRSARRGIILVAAIVAVFAGRAVIPNELFEGREGLLPSFPWVFVLAIGAASLVRILLVLGLLPKAAPRGEVFRFERAIRGGGDPNLIPHGLEHQVGALKRDAASSNRVKRLGFEMNTGGVVDTGTFGGKLIVETQPVPVKGAASGSTNVLLLLAAVVSCLALWMTFSTPDYVGRGGGDEIAQSMIGARWAARLLSALILAAIASGLFRHARAYLDTYRFHSLAVVINVEGNYGRSHVRVGKAVHDSVESDNVVVRSDCSLQGCATSILSESFGLLGPRDVVSMLVDDDARETERVVVDWIEDFAAKGAGIAAIDLGNQAVADVSNVNTMLHANRAAAKEVGKQRALRGDANALELPVSMPAKALTSDPLPNAAQGPDGGEQSATKSCPDCAETIKAAARKCRYCGYRYSEATGE